MKKYLAKSKSKENYVKIKIILDLCTHELLKTNVYDFGILIQ